MAHPRPSPALCTVVCTYPPPSEMQYKSDAVWCTVAQYNLDGTVDAYTFTGNFIYLRARVTPEATNIGSVDKILLNY